MLLQEEINPKYIDVFIDNIQQDFVYIEKNSPIDKDYEDCPF